MTTPPRPTPVCQAARGLRGFVLTLPLLLPLAAADSPGPTSTFRVGGQTLTVPAGFTVERVAGPPAVNRPISIAFDEQGRLYATDSSGLSERAQMQFEEKPHRIVRLEDTDGDGRYDRSTVFADRMMFPQGALFHDGSLYVAAPPHLWKLTDRDGDGVADERTEWWDGRTLTGCANDVHGPYLGPDGWFYWTKGAFAEQRHTLGDGRPFVTRAAHIYRARPDGTRFEPVLTGGMDNPVGVAFTSGGERILCGTFFQIPAAGRRDGLIHSIYGGVYGKENAATAGHPRTGDLLPIMTHMGAAAPCGIATYRSEVFGAGFADNLFVCYFNLRKVVRHTLVPDGATFRTTEADFLTSDSPDFRPTDVLEDADGSLLVVDTGGWYKICCPTSQLAKPDVLGGIYRIRKTGAPAIADPRGLRLPWASCSAADLAARLADGRPEVRERAQQLLGGLGATAVPALQAVLRPEKPALARRHAVWTLARIAAPAARQATRSALADPDPKVVHAALQVTSLWRDAAALEALLPRLHDANPLFARLAAEALGRIGDAGAIPALLAAADRLGATARSATGTPEHPSPRAGEHALIHALVEINQPELLHARLKEAASPSLARVVLVALDQMAAGDLRAAEVLPRLRSSDPVVARTARWIVSHRTEWGADLAGYFRSELDRSVDTPAASAALAVQLAELAKAPAIQELLATTARGGAREARLVALRAIAGAGLKETPGAWLGALTGLLTAADPELAGLAVAAARTLALPKGGDPALSAALARLGRQPDAGTPVRLDALALAAPTLRPLEPALFDFLLAHLAPKQPLPLRTAAAATLGRAPLAPDQQLALAAALRSVGALEAPRLLPAFERQPTEELGRKLIAALEKSPALAGLNAGLLRPLFARYPASLQPAAGRLIAMVNADAARQNARVEEVLPAVKSGDIRRGQAVFNSDRTACKLCHKVGYLGGLLGPDLTAIGRIRSERELLEAIMYPSATLVRGYEPVLVTLKNGESHGGIVKKDASDELVLATGPETEAHLARAEVVDLQPGSISPMPPGMDVVLSPQELADLVAFLKSRT